MGRTGMLGHFVRLDGTKAWSGNNGSEGFPDCHG